MLSSLDEFNSFDDFEVKIIDLSKEYIQRNKSDNYSSINCIADLQALIKEIKSVKKSKIVIVAPKNENFKYYYLNSTRNYEKVKKIKNILSNIMFYMIIFYMSGNRKVLLISLQKIKNRIYL